MTPPIHVSAIGVLLAFVFGGPLIGVLLWMLRAPGPSSADLGRPRPPREEARLILIAVSASTDLKDEVDLLTQLASERQAAILLLYVIEVPWTLPLGAKLDAADREAQAALDTAKEVVAQHALPVRTTIKRARETAAGILEAAREYQVDVVLRPGLRKPRGRLAARKSER